MREYKDVVEILEILIKNSLRSFKTSISLDRIELEVPKEAGFGNLSTNVALKIARQIKQNPSQISDKIIINLKEQIDRLPVKDDIEDIRNINGFINFLFRRDYFYDQLRKILKLRGKFGKLNIGKGRRVLIEFVSANPTGPLSIAHARQAAIGDVLANVLEFLGFRLSREYYINDEGNQIDILGSSIDLRLKELRGEKISFPSEYYQGSYIYDIAREIKNKKSKIKNLSDHGVKCILNIIKKELEDFGVKFDYWYSQKDLRKKGNIKKALGLLKRKGFIYEKDGALWFRSSNFGDDKNRVVVKKDKTFTYIASDIAYHQGKYKRGFSWLINLWGPDHHGYINRLRSAVQALGKPLNSLSIIIVQLVTIFRDSLALQMSTRKGQYIGLREVLNEVGCDTSRFFFLMRRTSSHLAFDLKTAKKQTPENPVYYIQYAHARICSIMDRLKRNFNFRNANLNLLKEKEELKLLRTLSEFPYYVRIVLRTLDPYIMTVYLQGLANDFHKFYDTQRVLVKDSELKLSRLCLIEGARTILTTGLELLGLSKPEKM